MYLLAVNCTANPQTTTVSVDAVIGKGVESDFGPMPKVADGKIEFSFGPIEYVMLRFEQ